MARNSMTNIIEYDARDELIQKVVYEISNDLSSALDSNKYITDRKSTRLNSSH